MGKKNNKRVKTEAKTYRGPIDDILYDKNLWRKPMAKDGSCLFRAVSEQVYCSQCYHTKVREKCVDYIGAHRNDFKEFITVSFDEYLESLSRELWGGELELVVLSRVYRRSIVVYNEVDPRKIQEQIFAGGADDDKNLTSVDKLTNPILLAYLNGNHYDAVYTVHHRNALSFCQGLLYTALMEKVFAHTIPGTCKKKLTTLQYAEIEKVDYFRDKPPNKGDVEAKALVNLRRHYITEEIVAMSWSIYHNSALNLHKKKKETIEAKDRSMAANIQFSVGDKCWFSIDGQKSMGEIIRLHTKPNQHMVRIFQSDNDIWEIPAKNLMLVSPVSNRKVRGKQQQHGRRDPVSMLPQMSSPAYSRSHDQQSGEKSVPLGAFPARVSQPQESSMSHGPPHSHTQGQQSQALKTQSSGKQPVSQVSASAHAQNHQDGQQRQKARVAPSAPPSEPTLPNSINQSVVPTSAVNPVKPQPTATSSRSSSKAMSSEKQVKETVQGVTRRKANPGNLVVAALDSVRQQQSVKSSGLPKDSPRTVPVSSQQKTSFGDSIHMAPYSSIVKKNSGGPSGSLTSEDTESESSSEDDAEARTPLESYPSVSSGAVSVASRQTSSQQGHQQVKQEFSPQDLQEKSSLHKVPAGASLVMNGAGLVNKDGRLPAHLSSGGTLQAESLYRQSAVDIVNPEPFPIYAKGLNGRESPYLDRKVMMDELSQKEAWPLIPDAPCRQHLSKDEGGISPYMTSSSRPSMIYAAVMSSHPPSVSSSTPAASTDFMFSPTPRTPISSSINLQAFQMAQQEKLSKALATRGPEISQSSSAEGARETFVHTSTTLPQPQVVKSVAVSSSPSQTVEANMPVLAKSSNYDHHLASGVMSLRTTLQHQFHSTGPLDASLMFASESSTPVSPSVRPSNHNPRLGATSMSSSEKPHYSSPSLPFSALRTYPGSAGPTHYHNYSAYGKNTIPISSSLAAGSGNTRPVVTKTTASSSLIPVIISTAEARIMEGAYEAGSSDTPVYVSPPNLVPRPLEKMKCKHDNPNELSSSVAGVTAPNSTMLTGQLEKTLQTSSARLTAAPTQAHVVHNTPPPPAPPLALPVMVDAPIQTDLTGAPEMQDAETITADVYVAQEMLAPPSMSLDSLADKLTFCVKYSIQCLQLHDSSSGLVQSMEELLTGQKIQELFLFYHHHQQQQQQQQEHQQQRLQQMELSSMWLKQQQQAAAMNQPHPLNPPDMEPSPQAFGNDDAAEVEAGSEERDSKPHLENEDVLPEQEHYVDSPCVGGAEVPPLHMHPANFNMMMQRPPPPHMPPGPFMFSSNPFCYPMIPPPPPPPPPHIAMHHPLMGFLPYMPQLFPPHLMPSPPSPVPDMPLREIQQNQENSCPSSPQLPVSMDSPSDNCHLDQGAENAPSPDQLVLQSEMVPSAGLPIPPSVMSQPLQMQGLQFPPGGSVVAEQNVEEKRVEVASPLASETVAHQGQLEQRDNHGLEERVEKMAEVPESVLLQAASAIPMDNIASSEPQVKKSNSTHSASKSMSPSSITPSGSSRPIQSLESLSTQHQKMQSMSFRQTEKTKLEWAKSPGLPCRPATTVSVHSPSAVGATREEEKMKSKSSSRGEQGAGESQQKKMGRHPHKSGKHSGKRRSDPNSDSVSFNEPRACSNTGPNHQDPLRRFPVEVSDSGEPGSLFTRDTMLFKSLRSPTDSSETSLDSKDGNHNLRTELSVVRETDVVTETNEWPDFSDDFESSKPKSAVWMHINTMKMVLSDKRQKRVKDPTLENLGLHKH